MWEVLRASSNGVGLAANQVGVAKRMFVVVAGGRPQVFINPEVSNPQGACEMEEGCLSFPGLSVNVKRAASIHLRAMNINGQTVELDLDGLAARIVLHEVDHLDGKLIIDHLPAAEEEANSKSSLWNHR